MRLVFCLMALALLGGCHAHHPSSYYSQRSTEDDRHDLHRYGEGKFCPPGQIRNDHC